MTLRNPLRNPYYRSGSVVARLSVNLATAIWAFVLLAKTDALTQAPSTYAWITAYIHEDLLASFWGALAITQTIWLLAHWSPMELRGVRLCALGYGTMFLGWSFVLWNIILGPRPIQPTSAACVSVVCILAAFAFVSNARDDDAAGT